MTEGRIVVGVDIGTSKVTSVVARVDSSVNVLGVSEAEAVGIKKGQIVDIEAAVLSINTSLEAAERMAGYSASRVVVSLGGAHIESQNSRGVVAVSHADGEIAENDLIRVIDAAKAVSLPSSREIIHVLPRSYIVDGQEGIKDPIGMTGIRLEVDTHIVSASSTTVKNLEKAFSQVGVDVEAIVFSGYASALGTLSDTEKELGVVLVDIGAGTTDISIFVEGSVAYSSVIPIGARHITNDLAIGLRISLESSEKIKLHLSGLTKESRRITLDGAERKSLDEIDLGTLNIPEDLNKASYKTLVDGIIRPRLNEIFTFIGLDVKKSGFAGQIPSGLVVTGGGANTVGVQDAAKRMLAMPVRIGSPTGMKGIIDEVQGPSFSTVIGLIKYGSTLEDKTSLPFGFSMPKIPGLRIDKTFSRVISFIKSFMP
ncbi:MAG: cell division protein FtsA [Candidatus Levyibacteriota bacterium]